MNIKLNPNDEDTSYTANVESPQELHDILVNNDLLRDPHNFEVPKVFDWFDKLKEGCMVISIKDLKCSLQPQVVKMKKIKFSQDYIYENRNLTEERMYPVNFSTEQIEEDFKEWCNQTIKSEWVEVRDID